MKISSALLNISNNILPEKLFEFFADQPWAIWLDSCNSNHVDSQFDIMVWQPCTTLITVDDVTDISTHGYKAINEPSTVLSHESSTDDPLKLLEVHQSRVFANAEIAESHLPFKAGSIGLYAYDLGRRFEKISSNAQKDIQLADMAVGIYQQAIIFDHQQQKYFLVSEESKQQTLVQALEKLIHSVDEAPQNNSPTKHNDFSLTSDWRANMTKHEYQTKFNRVQEALIDGDCYQVNLAQRFSAKYQGNEFEAYKTLRQSNKAPFSAFMNFEQHAILSLSPERFIRLKEGKVQSKPIKGTMPRSDDGAIDKKNADILKVSTKDRAENLMIVDLLRNDISRTCKAGSVKVPSLFDIESFPAVHHLVSTIEGEIEEHFTATDLLRGAFPGGSITGAPKISAMEVIEELEPQRRSLYCGSIGYISACGNMDTSITIRTLICERTDKDSNGKIYCWAGGGLVADSNVDAEYQETFDKVNKILPVLSA